MTNFLPTFCSGSSFGAPDFGALHPIVEQIKEDAEAQRHARQPRVVDLVLKFAKKKGENRSALHKAYTGITGHDFRSALHWALRIDGKYFELRVVPGTRQTEFVTGVWDHEKLKDVTGQHYTACWGIDYAVLTNNCQKLLIAVCKECLEEPDAALAKGWSGYKLGRIPVIVLRPYSHGALRLLGCPKDLRYKYDEALVDLYLAENSLLASSRAENYYRLKTNMKETTAPFETLLRSWAQRIAYNVHVSSAPMTLAPWVKNLQDCPEKAYITNTRNESQKWTNRMMLIPLPAQLLIGSAYFFRDFGLFCISEPQTLSRSLDRWSDARFESRLQRIENDTRGGIGMSCSQNARVSMESVDAAYDNGLEAVKRFWAGQGTWEDITLSFQRMMKTEGLSWTDVEAEIQRERKLKEASFVRQDLNTKEKRVKRLMTFTFWAIYVVGLLGALAAGHELEEALSSLRPAVDLA